MQALLATHERLQGPDVPFSFSKAVTVLGPRPGLGSSDTQWVFEESPCLQSEAGAPGAAGADGTSGTPGAGAWHGLPLPPSPGPWLPRL